MKSDRLDDRLRNARHLIGADPSGTDDQEKIPSRYLRLATTLGGEVIEDPAGMFCLVTTLYPVGHKLGHCSLPARSLRDTVKTASFTANEVEGEISLERLLFIDTETTGLGGTGALAFLIGCASVTAEGLEIRQYVLPDYADEAAMLERVLGEFDADRTIASYNGLAFDINLIRDRMILNRVAREVPQAGHVDLLHVTRRLYRRRLRDCSLTNVEREIFGFHRTGDIPGYLIPSVYFDWLQSDNTAELEAVMEHNRLDILTLYFLALHIDEVFSPEGDRLEHVDDRYSLARVYGRRRQVDKVADELRDLEGTSGGALPDDVLLYHAGALKRLGEIESAVVLWQRLSEGKGRESYEACIELAKHFEHKRRDPERARLYCRQAHRIGPPSPARRDELRHRLDRLDRKLTG